LVIFKIFADWKPSEITSKTLVERNPSQIIVFSGVHIPDKDYIQFKFLEKKYNSTRSSHRKKIENQIKSTLSEISCAIKLSIKIKIDEFYSSGKLIGDQFLNSGIYQTVGRKKVKLPNSHTMTLDKFYSLVSIANGFYKLISELSNQQLEKFKKECEYDKKIEEIMIYIDFLPFEGEDRKMWDSMKLVINDLEGNLGRLKHLNAKLGIWMIKQEDKKTIAMNLADWIVELDHRKANP